MDLSKMISDTFSNTTVKVLGGDIQQGEWKYETGTLWGAFDQVDMQGMTKSVTMQTEESIKKVPEMAVWGIGGALIFGPLGALAGAVIGGNRKQVCALIELKDGRKFLATMDTKIYQELLALSLQKS